MTIEAAVFYSFSAVAILFSLSVVLLRNPVTSALSLVVSFFGVSGIFVLLHAPFLGVIQILVYAGAILVLFLYVTMLLNVGRVEPALVKSVSFRLTALAGGVALGIALFLFTAFPGRPEKTMDAEFGSLASVGEQLLGPYVLLFELVSVVLLVGIVGAIILTRKGEKT